MNDYQAPVAEMRQGLSFCAISRVDTVARRANRRENREAEETEGFLGLVFSAVRADKVRAVSTERTVIEQKYPHVTELRHGDNFCETAR